LFVQLLQQNPAALRYLAPYAGAAIGEYFATQADMRL
jgi:F0F1-type ATP synthase alpha subunit